MQLKIRPDRSEPQAEDMSGFHIWCFDCNKKTQKRLLRTHHLNHEVDWIRDSDGARYARLPDGTVPKVNHAIG